jgi:hypothetical protein
MMQLYISIALAVGDTFYFATAMLTASSAWKARKDKKEPTPKARQLRGKQQRRHRH